MLSSLIVWTLPLFVLPDPHAGSGKCDPGQYDGKLHQHLPAGGNTRTVEGTESWENASFLSIDDLSLHGFQVA